MSGPLVSVVMATWNGIAFLEEAVTSVINQSLQEFEFIIVDDGSTDGSLDLLRQYARWDPRINIVSQAHAGLVEALNRGCALARGRYIARLDSDDIAKPQRLEIQVRYLDEHPTTVLLGGHIECINENGDVLFMMAWPGSTDGLHDYMLLDCCVSHTTVMFRRDVFVRLGGYRSEFRHAEDYDLFLRMSDKDVIDNLPLPLCQYRLHREQVSMRDCEQQVISGVGARIVTRHRRASHREPILEGEYVGRGDLKRWGVDEQRLESLIGEYYAAKNETTGGWRWTKLPFCRVIPSARK